MRKGKRRVTLAINVLSNTVILKSSYSIFFSSSSAKKTSNNEIYIQKPITLLKISQAYTILKANGSHKFF